jgi:predicted AAA+ superfamily ATPase
MKDRPYYGRLVENAVGAAFVNDEEKIYYWSERDKEVDFVVQRSQELLAIEVKTGNDSHAPGLKTFLNRYPDARAVRIGGPASDLSVEQFLQSGL